MQPFAQKVRRGLSLVFLALALLIVGGSDRAHALTDGWNLIQISSCVGGQFNGVDYLYILPKTGGFLFTTDPVTLSVAGNFCANGNAFYAFLSGGVWNGVTLYPGFK
jgi:hypothetical protein